MTKHKPSEYRAIAMWGARMGSMSYYIENEQEHAANDGARLDAVYREHGTGAWICVTDFAPDHPFRKEYEEQAAA